VKDKTMCDGQTRINPAVAGDAMVFASGVLSGSV
jgi:hypothetical protein